MDNKAFLFFKKLCLFNYREINVIRAVLVAISIPIFTSQLEKSREAVDAANIRAAYAEVASSALTSDKVSWKSNAITIKQQKTSWQSTIDFPTAITNMATIMDTTLPTQVWVQYVPGTAGAAGTFTVVSTDPGSTFKVAGTDD